MGEKEKKEENIRKGKKRREGGRKEGKYPYLVSLFNIYVGPYDRKKMPQKLGRRGGGIFLCPFLVAITEPCSEKNDYKYVCSRGVYSYLSFFAEFSSP